MVWQSTWGKARVVCPLQTSEILSWSFPPAGFIFILLNLVLRPPPSPPPSDPCWLPGWWCRVAEKAAESTVYHSAAETQMTAILKAANSLMKQLGQGKQEAQALLEMTGGAAETAAALAASKGAAVAAVVPAKAARQQPAGAKPAAAANLQNTGGWR